MKSKTLLKKVSSFWREVMNDESVNIQYRLKASEVCLKLKEAEEGEGGVVIISGEDELE